MKKTSGARLLLIAPLALVLISSGCTSTALELPANSPARVDAPSGRVEIEPAAILRPDAPLYPSDGPAAPAELENRQLEQVAVSYADAPEPEGTREAPYVGQGVIQRIGEGQLEIQHEAIPGFMGAMRMTFSISEEAMNDSLEVGDEIIFKIENHPEHGYQIFSVDALAAESDEAPANETEHQHNSPGPTGSSTP